jgi:hypothetical protein
MVSVFETDLYKQDKIGLKSLNDRGKLSFLTIESEHLYFFAPDILHFLDFLFNANFKAIPYGTIMELDEKS